ncbi:MAG: hypothetical protein M3R43_10690, partial [Acidobacteriota bacterium]|nr:hypothetical protein [Acidobacteriota bacterium]
MSDITSDRVNVEIAETLKHLERPALSRDSLFLLVTKLLELRNPDKNIIASPEGGIDIVEMDGAKTQIFLHNLYSECQRHPEERVEIVERYLRVLGPDSTLESATREDVIAVVRDSEYRAFLKPDE